MTMTNKKLPVVFPLATTLRKLSQKNNDNNKARSSRRANERLTKQYLNECMEDIKRELIKAVSNGLYSITVRGADNDWFIPDVFLVGLRLKFDHRGFLVYRDCQSEMDCYVISWLNPNKDIINKRREASKKLRAAKS